MENDKTMNKHILPILLAGLLCFSVFPAVAQDETESENRHEHYYPIAKSSLDGPRFEVLTSMREENSSLFKIDKYTGDVWNLPISIGSPNKLVKCTKEMTLEDVADEGKINYQLIFISPARVYLLNLNTGVMWEYRSRGFFSNRWEFKLLEEQL